MLSARACTADKRVKLKNNHGEVAAQQLGGMQGLEMPVGHSLLYRASKGGMQSQCHSTHSMPSPWGQQEVVGRDCCAFKQSLLHKVNDPMHLKDVKHTWVSIVFLNTLPPSPQPASCANKPPCSSEPPHPWAAHSSRAWAQHNCSNLHAGSGSRCLP